MHTHPAMHLELVDPRAFPCSPTLKQRITGGWVRFLNCESNSAPTPHLQVAMKSGWLSSPCPLFSSFILCLPFILSLPHHFFLSLCPSFSLSSFFSPSNSFSLPYFLPSIYLLVPRKLPREVSSSLLPSFKREINLRSIFELHGIILTGG